MDKKLLKVLLLQVRDNELVRAEELNSFVQFTGLKVEQFVILNVFDTPDFNPEIAQGYDAVFVGGASEASVLEPDNFPFVLNGQALLLYCLERSIPTFASCYGFQLAVLALGGDITRDSVTVEMGTVTLAMTDAARLDPLFSHLPAEFDAVAVHKEKAVALPDNCELLAYTDYCCHAFRVKEKPFWAFQFHPEVDQDILRSRLTIYSAEYTDGPEHLQKILSEVSATPYSNRLLSLFIDEVLC